MDALCYAIEEHEQFFLQVIHEFNDEEIDGVMSVAWALWRNRNNIVWRGESSTPTQVVYTARVSVEEWKSARIPSSSVERPAVCSKSHVPPEGFVKIQVDAGLFKDELVTGIGMVLSDGEGHFVAARTVTRDRLMRVADGEAWGVVEALTWGVLMNLQFLIVETDAKRVSDAINSTDIDHSSFGDLIKVGRGCYQLVAVF